MRIELAHRRCLMVTSVSCNEQPWQVDSNYILLPQTPAVLLMRPRLKEETVAGLAWSFLLVPRDTFFN